MKIIIEVAIGFMLDIIFGDPPWLPHPIRLIGWFISKGEKLLGKAFPKSQKGEFMAGAVLAILVTAGTFIIPFLLLYFLSRVSIYAEVAVASLFCYQILAAKSLKTESMRVYYHLKNHDMANARKYLSWIVGRDTQNLTEEGITKAAVETVAENTSDGVIAPLIFLVIGGAPLGFLYKAVNTMDSMIGYKNDKYLYFGRFAARFDDVLNFIPAILSAYIMIGASFVCGLDYKNALMIYRRDKRNHSSPNSAKTEAVCAGALNVQLAGDAYYFGKLVKKKTIGDNNRKIKPDDIKTANKLMYATAFIAFVILCGCRLVVSGGIK
ncbi:cobalamin biosynthesis protein CobD [Ruminiclostridium papyrosolvens DSM 2782]|uniref:Cobalamin biosynthesis protein CobD n=1 Tax=Ruminiclostridium papyrosolvens DSM 2782 TaxID=588581 RepID=F1T8X3_9FIRM|nr:adenosylcobinamide-phosphate synthase CbiB [Ruminiclostridium papyrosolvens]EGD48955.1 cobalamin biosynthesis protein CobD [Ruminiclostridium papyrosolvens DSM 2782]WES35439.1 adenosylcobinamide-phosphate synthase CbiB [Ruminiclostridium papyrosolvens DSM 2782]